jgi:hypothetical protein
MTLQSNQTSTHQDTQKNSLNKRLEDIGWALFLTMIGCILLVPAKLVPQGAWLIGTGLIMLGINLVRYLNGIKVSAFTVILGTFALAAGFGDLFGVKLPLFAIFLILMGISIMLKLLIEKKG